MLENDSIEMESDNNSSHSKLKINNTKRNDKNEIARWRNVSSLWLCNFSSIYIYLYNILRTSIALGLSVVSSIWFYSHTNIYFTESKAVKFVLMRIHTYWKLCVDFNSVFLLLCSIFIAQFFFFCFVQLCYRDITNDMEVIIITHISCFMLTTQL